MRYISRWLFIASTSVILSNAGTVFSQPADIESSAADSLPGKINAWFPKEVAGMARVKSDSHGMQGIIADYAGRRQETTDLPEVRVKIRVRVLDEGDIAQWKAASAQPPMDGVKRVQVDGATFDTGGGRSNANRNSGRGLIGSKYDVIVDYERLWSDGKSSNQPASDALEALLRTIDFTSLAAISDRTPERVSAEKATEDRAAQLAALERAVPKSIAGTPIDGQAQASDFQQSFQATASYEEGKNLYQFRCIDFLGTESGRSKFENEWKNATSKTAPEVDAAIRDRLIDVQGHRAVIRARAGKHTGTIEAFIADRYVITLIGQPATDDQLADTFRNLDLSFFTGGKSGKYSGAALNKSNDAAAAERKGPENGFAASTPLTNAQLKGVIPARFLGQDRSEEVPLDPEKANAPGYQAQSNFSSDSTMRLLAVTDYLSSGDFAREQARLWRERAGYVQALAGSEPSPRIISIQGFKAVELPADPVSGLGDRVEWFILDRFVIAVECRSSDKNASKEPIIEALEKMDISALTGLRAETPAQPATPEPSVLPAVVEAAPAQPANNTGTSAQKAEVKEESPIDKVNNTVQKGNEIKKGLGGLFKKKK